MKEPAVRLLALILLATASRAAAQTAAAGSEEPASPVAVHLPSCFYMRLAGEIDSRYPVVINLMRDGGTVVGDYCPSRVAIPVEFGAGSRVSDDGAFTLRGGPGSAESGGGAFGGGSFEGRFTTDHAASGTWTSPDGARSLPFSLAESYPPGSARFEVTRAERTWVAERGQASIEIIYPVMTSAEHPSTAARINSQLFSTLLSGYHSRARLQATPTVGALLDDFIDRFLDEAHSADLPEGYKPTWEDLLEASVAFNGEGILGIREMAFTFEGGAHPSTIYRLANYDIATGRLIALSDILKAGYQPELNALGEAALRRKYGVPPGESLAAAHFFVKNGAFSLPDNFLITAGGIEFQFNQYEIAPYYFGSPVLFIPYSAITDLIRPGGAIARLAR